jgi:diacylglycerol kinase family enzyme
MKTAGTEKKERSENSGKPVPLYYNADAGSSAKILAQLQVDSRIKIESVSPAAMEEVCKKTVKQGEKRLLIGGGDGTIALTAAHLIDNRLELGIIPCGTLNHFAQRVGIPLDPAEALEVALHGRARAVDGGYVNDLFFINTSSVGAYPVFVRSRRKLQNRMSYFPATLLAGFRRLLKFRRVEVSLSGKVLRTPLVFIGVGERSLRLPEVGQVTKQGEKGLHLIAVHSSTGIEVLTLLITSLFFGIDPLQKKRRIENQLVDHVELHFHHRKKRVLVALDGELVWLHTPLKYRFAPGEIMVALPGK